MYEQLAAYALVAASGGTYNDILKGVLRTELRTVVEKLRAVIDSGSIVQPNRKAELRIALGRSLQVLGDLEGGTERVESSIEQFEAALQDVGVNGDATTVIKALNGLGIALMTLGERRSSPQLANSAANVFRDIVNYHSPETAPEERAIAYNNLGNALALSGKLRRDPELLKEAINSYESALEVRSAEEVPRAFARTQINLGIAVALLGLHFRDETTLEDAEKIFSQALDLLSFEDTPSDWAMAQMNLGNTLQTLGEVKRDSSRLSDAVSAFEKALKVYTWDRAPLKWANANYNTAQSLVHLGQLRSSSNDFRAAVERYELALRAYPMDREKFRWAETQGGLGVAYVLLADRETEPKYFVKAIKSFLSGLRVYTCADTPSHCSGSYRNLEATVSSLLDLEEGDFYIDEIKSEFRSAMAEFCGNGEQYKWESVQKVVHSLATRVSDKRQEPKVIARQGVEEQRQWLTSQFADCADN